MKDGGGVLSPPPPPRTHARKQARNHVRTHAGRQNRMIDGKKEARIARGPKEEKRQHEIAERTTRGESAGTSATRAGCWRARGAAACVPWCATRVTTLPIQAAPASSVTAGPVLADPGVPSACPLCSDTSLPGGSPLFSSFGVLGDRVPLTPGRLSPLPKHWCPGYRFT